MPFNEGDLVFSKCLALIAKTKRRVEQVDSSSFPTESSDKARALLLNTLNTLEKKDLWGPINPEVLFNSLIRLQSLVHELETSNNEHISGPLVSYCDNIWKIIFTNRNANIFYSETSEHNYTIYPFSTRLRSILSDVLTSDQIEAIIGDKNLYCLQLASLENENLPLYAIIGHEFGHALYWSREKEIFQILAQECDQVFRSIAGTFSQQDTVVFRRRVKRTAFIIEKIAVELFCDLFGALIAGPAFLLSLQEMAWGSNPSIWTVALSPQDQNIRAYPSFSFRLHCVKKSVDVNQFETDTKKAFSSLKDTQLRTIPSYFSVIVSNHAPDQISIRGADSDTDRQPIQAAIGSNLSALKAAYEKFLTRCSNDFLADFRKQPEFRMVSGDHVFELLRRLECNILPNIIPDGTLLGTPASFASILNASALYRVHLLATRNKDQEPAVINREVQKLERLTAKSMEVSYVQREFKNWETKKGK